MEATTTKENIVYENEGITIMFDEDFINRYDDENQLDCVALIEPNMGYGVYFANDGHAGSYGNCLFRNKVLSMFWNEHEEQIKEWLDDAYNAQDKLHALVEVGVSILVSLTEELLEDCSEHENCVGT